MYDDNIDCGGLGGKLPVVSGTGVINGEDLFEGHSWMMRVLCCSTQLGWDCLAVWVPYSIHTCPLEMYM